MGVHDGHRERLKEQFAEHGLEVFNEINALELLLFYAIPRVDTNELAHSLLDRFGSLSQIFSASIDELLEVKGIGKNTAILLTLVPEIFKKSLICETKEMTHIGSYREAGRFLIPRFLNCSRENFLMLCLDTKNNIISCDNLGVGFYNEVDVSIRRVVETALKSKASSVIIAHNHPSGTLAPSIEDESVTEKISSVLRSIGVTLNDHIIVSGEQYLSMANISLDFIFR